MSTLVTLTHVVAIGKCRALLDGASVITTAGIGRPDTTSKEIIRAYSQQLDEIVRGERDFGDWVQMLTVAADPERRAFVVSTLLADKLLEYAKEALR